MRSAELPHGSSEVSETSTWARKPPDRGWLAVGARVLASPWPLVALVACGGLLRIELWAHNRSLWGGEGALALNIIGKSAAGLKHRLDYLQGAPTGFLLTER